MVTGLTSYFYLKMLDNFKRILQNFILRKSDQYLRSWSVRVRGAASIQTFGFSALCTSIPRGLLKSRMGSMINNAFKHRNGDV